MKTAIDIPDAELKEALRRRMAEATRVLGASDAFMTPEALRQARSARRTA